MFVWRKKTHLKNIGTFITLFGSNSHFLYREVVVFTAELSLKSVTHEMRSFLSSQKYL